MEPLKERSSNYLHPGLGHDHNPPRRKSFSEASSGGGGPISPIAHSFPRRRSYVVRNLTHSHSHKRISEQNRNPVNNKRNPADYCQVGIEGSLVPTDLAAGKGRRKSWFGDLG